MSGAAGAAMECLKCHTPLPNGSKFCFACGADVTGGGTVGATTSGMEGLMTRLQRLVQGKYRVDRLLGKGGMGAVFRAYDLRLEREVAIKVLPPDISMDEDIVKRFQQEARTAANLAHANIIPIHDVASEGGLNYFVMKYIEGTSLEDVLDQKQPLSIDYIQRVLWEAACALGHAHQRGVVHRDVKPANIMFDHDGQVMLTDFGISKALQAASGFTGTGMIIGTPHYMAPEQAKGGTVDGRADQYSLAVVAYRMITGELPYTGDSVHTILYKHVFEEVPRVSGKRVGTPEFLAGAVSRALSKEPDQRFGTMEEFATAVWPEQPVSAAKPGTPKRQRRPPASPSHVTRRVGADTPTEMTDAPTDAPTTPIPQAAMKFPAARKRRSSVGVVVGTLVVVAVGVGGYVALGGKAALPPQPAPQAGPQVAPTSAPPTAPVETPSQLRRGAANRRPTAPPPAPPPAPPAVASRQGYVSVNSNPPGTLFIDGRDMGSVPVIEQTLSEGRHTIRVERAGYKTKTETINVPANTTVRRTYVLEQEEPE